MSRPGPRARLRTRLSLAFLLVALSGVGLVSAYVVLGLNRRIAAEITRRQEEVAAAARALIQEESERALRAVDGYATQEELMREALDPLERPEDAEEDEAELLRRRNAALDAAARALGLDFLALASVQGGEPTTVASAHYRAAVYARAPSLVGLAPATSATVGFALALLPLNPPRAVPALLAVRRVGRFVLWGGVRLDGPRLEALADNSRAFLSLSAPGLALPLTYGAPGTSEGGAVLRLAVLPGGLSDTLTPGSGEPRLSIQADVARLEEIRRLFSASAGVAVLIALTLALLASAWLSRRLTAPILELAQAAERIGAGDLEVQLVPRSQDEVGELVQVFNQMSRELKESRAELQRAERIAAWREIARRVAHEIKNPLFPIQMSMETLRKGFKNKHPALEEIVEESTRTVLEEVRALNRIVGEFSDFARLPAPRLEPTPMAELLAHVRALYAEGARGRSGAPVAVDLLPLPELPPVMADREQIGRALINLVKNAVEAMPERGGHVRLRARPEPRGDRAGVLLEVEDDGAGIPPELQAQIFTPYFTTKADGSGLGLAIVERIVGEHQGAISLESTPGSGACFRVWLPAAAT